MNANSHDTRAYKTQSSLGDRFSESRARSLGYALELARESRRSSRKTRVFGSDIKASGDRLREKPFGVIKRLSGAKVPISTRASGSSKSTDSDGHINPDAVAFKKSVIARKSAHKVQVAGRASRKS